MSDPAELSELESILTSGGWARFKAYCEKEWGPAGETYQAALNRALSGPLGTEVESVHRMKNVAYAQEAVRAMLQWPAMRIAQIQGRVDRAEAAGGPSRRGPGL